MCRRELMCSKWSYMSQKWNVHNLNSEPGREVLWGSSKCKIFYLKWRKEFIHFTVWAKLVTEEIIFCYFFPALCVCYPCFWELSALCVVPEASCMAFGCINCETGGKEIDSDRKEKQKIIASGLHREQREKIIQGNLQIDISQWFLSDLVDAW